jgi:hypothetical protein
VAAFLCQSSRHALSLCEDGICYAVEPDDDPEVAACVGAQFVATLDPEVPGLLGTELREGISLLLIKVIDAHGRVKMLRFGPLVRCEAIAPRRDSGFVRKPDEAPTLMFTRPRRRRFP